MIVSKKYGFDAAHLLPYYEGKCHNLHGHHFDVVVGIKGPIDPLTGMVVDFSWLKGVLEADVGKFDHTYLNKYIDNPTAELLAKFIFYLVESRCTGLIHVEYVRVWETEGSMAEYNHEDWMNEKDRGKTERTRSASTEASKSL
jgi:6-pyruvoyltetrahydropterin/6-carboxytetrahydropterin synthase